MSPEGLNQRFNAAAVRLLQRIVSLLLKQTCYTSGTLPSEYSGYFSRIRILDSTTFQLPDSFAASYKGTGGCSHTAGVKIQLEYDLQIGQFIHLHTSHGKENDKTYGSACLQDIQQKDVFIRDLGYFCLEDLHTIHEKEAYYISRLKLNTRYIKRTRIQSIFGTARSRRNRNTSPCRWKTSWKVYKQGKR